MAIKKEAPKQLGHYEGVGEEHYLFVFCACGLLMAVRGTERLTPVTGRPHTCPSVQQK